jgi:hypothetical protein
MGLDNDEKRSVEPLRQVTVKEALDLHFIDDLSLGPVRAVDFSKTLSVRDALIFRFQNMGFDFSFGYKSVCSFYDLMQNLVDVRSNSFGYQPKDLNGFRINETSRPRFWGSTLMQDI